MNLRALLVRLGKAPSYVVIWLRSSWRSESLLRIESQEGLIFRTGTGSSLLVLFWLVSKWVIWWSLSWQVWRSPFRPAVFDKTLHCSQVGNCAGLECVVWDVLKRSKGAVVLDIACVCCLLRPWELVSNWFWAGFRVCMAFIRHWEEKSGVPAAAALVTERMCGLK